MSNLPPNVARAVSPDVESPTAAGGGLPDVTEAELNEFCETSSWETSSALSENDERQSKAGDHKSAPNE